VQSGYSLVAGCGVIIDDVVPPLWAVGEAAAGGVAICPIGASVLPGVGAGALGSGEGDGKG
jgi:hypothetical protein